MGLMCMFKKFWILASSFEGTSHFDTPKFGQILSFAYIYTYLKDFMWPAENDKKFEFWRASFGGKTHFGTPNFC